MRTDAPDHVTTDNRGRCTVAWSCGVALATLLLAGLPRPADAQTWKKYRYPADRFEVEFSDVMKITPTELTAEAKERTVRATDYIQDSGTSAYIVNVTLAKYSINFERGTNSSFSALKCKEVMIDRPLKSANGRGREMAGEQCQDEGFRARAYYFTTGNWFFQVLYVLAKDADRAAGLYFLNSFKVIGK
jgi:hypothetical protein